MKISGNESTKTTPPPRTSRRIKAQRIIVALCFIVAILVALFVLIKKPQKLVSSNLYQEYTNPRYEKVSFPITETIDIIPSTYSINLSTGTDEEKDAHQYTIKLTNGSQTLYEYTSPKITVSNFNIPIDHSKIAPTSSPASTLEIDCLDSCEDLKYILYDTNQGSRLKVTTTYYATDYDYLWYSVYLFFLGLTLIPLMEHSQRRKHAKKDHH